MKSLLIAICLFATDVNPDTQFSVTVDGNTQVVETTGVQDGTNFKYQGTLSGEGWSLEWNFLVDQNPEAGSSIKPVPSKPKFKFTNTSQNAKSLSFVSVFLVCPKVDGTVSISGITNVSMQMNEGGGTLTSNGNDPLYTVMKDGGQAAQFAVAYFSPFIMSGTGSGSASTFSLLCPAASGGPCPFEDINQSIGEKFSFMVTPGEVVVFNGQAIYTPSASSTFNPTCTEPDPVCLGDLDGSKTVDSNDLGLLLGNWGSSGLGDLNNSGSVDGADLGTLLGAWGECQ